MNKLILICLLAPLISFGGKKAWPGVEYTEVKAFHWPVKMQTRSLIDKNFKFHKGVVDPKGKVLSKDQIAKLSKAINDKHPSHPAAGCYIPHNLFVFYNNGKPVAYAEICFDCMGYNAFPNQKFKYWDLKGLAALCKELGIPYGTKSVKKKKGK